MKFSQALKANSVPDWKHHYIHYSRLKKMIFRLEQLQGNAPLSPVPEHRQSLDFTNPSAPLLSRQSSSMLPRTSSGIEHGQIDELMFEREIHDELARVKAFYVEKVRRSPLSLRMPTMCVFRLAACCLQCSWSYALHSPRLLLCCTQCRTYTMHLLGS